MKTMSTTKRVLTALLAVMMAATALVSCGEKDTQTDSSTAESKPASSESSEASESSESSEAKDTKPLEFSVTTVGFGSSPEGKLIQNEWLKVTGELLGREIKPVYDFINVGDYSEKLKIICTGGDIPDLLSYGWGSQADLVKYGEEGLFEEVTQYMDQLPNYSRVLAADEKAKYSIYSPDGKLYAFYGATYQGDEPMTLSNNGASAVRKDILDKHGLEIPSTVEEFYQVAKKLKELYPDVYPIILHEEWQQPDRMLFAANRTANKRFYNGTEFVYGPTMEGYKDAIMEMHRWYEEGLISPDFFTHTSENGNAATASGTAFMIPSTWEGYPAKWKTEYPDQQWVLIPNIRNDKYGEPCSFYRPNGSEWQLTDSYSIVVSGNSKIKDDLLKLMDIQYSDEIVDLISWGIEGTTYQINDQGEKEFIPEFAADVEKWPELAFGQASSRAGIFPTPQNNIPNHLSQQRGDIFFDGKVHEDYRWVDAVNELYTDERVRPDNLVNSTPLSTDENEAYANIMTPVDTFAAEQKVKFIKGERSFDEWDQYLKEMNEMGDIQKAMDIYTSHVVK